VCSYLLINSYVLLLNILNMGQELTNVGYQVPDERLSRFVEWVQGPIEADM
jgi:hypothetical protein